VEGETKGRLSSSVELALYRIVQAALNNATKHARATGVTVQLQREALRMRCTVKDNGTGFDLASVLARHKDQGLGLLGIRERVTALGGSLQIDSGPGRGTTIRVEIPL
jgi:signal transduction histidine kinase